MMKFKKKLNIKSKTICFKIAGYAPPAPDIRQEPAPAISEAEFEEIMNRNRTVSSSAIARAVSDAAAGKFPFPYFVLFFLNEN